MKGNLKTFLLMILGSAVYAAATQFFVFSTGLFLGGTSGVSVILNHFFPNFSSGEFLMGINIALMLLALLILGKGMAAKTLIGSTLTTLFIGILDRLFPGGTALIQNSILSALVGAAAVAVGSAILFYADSSSGGTDILALIIKKYTSFPIGRALLVSDILIVAIGACISDPARAIGSVAGLLVKTFGIDLTISLIRRIQKKP